MPSDLREQLQSTLGSEYTLEREFGGGGVARDLVLRIAQISGWSRSYRTADMQAFSASVLGNSRERVLARAYLALTGPNQTTVTLRGTAGGERGENSVYQVHQPAEGDTVRTANARAWYEMMDFAKALQAP